MQITRLTGLTLLGAATGCGSILGPIHAIDVAATQRVVARGDPIGFEVTNTGRVTVTLGACPTALVTPGEPSRYIPVEGACPATLYTLNPDASLTITAPPQAVEPGEYRALVHYRAGTDAGEQREALSATFRVVAD